MSRAIRRRADEHDVIRVRGARVNNLRGVDVDIPKRLLTVFTGVSGSGKSSLVFGTVAAESQRLINETYPAFLQSFMGSPPRPEVELLENLSAAIVVDQERLGANSRSTVGTATDVYALLRILYSRMSQPVVGTSGAFSFNLPEGMCLACEGVGRVAGVDTEGLIERDMSLNEGAITVPNFKPGSWYWRAYAESGRLDPDKKLADYSEDEWQFFMHEPQTKLRIAGVNTTYEGLLPKVQRTFLSKERESTQPHIRAFIERIATFSRCQACLGTRLNERARTAIVAGRTLPECSALQISDLLEWVQGLQAPEVAPLLRSLREGLGALVEIGLGYLSLDREAGTLSGGEAQRVKMVRHLGSALADITYVFDEPTVGLHPHDIDRMIDLLVRLRDKGNTVLVVEHKPAVIARADHVVDLGPGAGGDGGPDHLHRRRRRSTRLGHPHRPLPCNRATAPCGAARADRLGRDPQRLDPQPRRRGRRPAARRAHRRDRCGWVGQVVPDPRVAAAMVGRAGGAGGRSVSDPRLPPFESGHLHRSARSDPGCVRQGQWCETCSVQR